MWRGLFQVDLTQYLPIYGIQLYNKLQKASIVNVLLQYPGLTLQQLLLPQDLPPESIPIYVQIVNQLIMGAQGHADRAAVHRPGRVMTEDCTVGNQPGIGIGDGVMVTGDVRALASEYCQRGVTVQYNQYGLDHVASDAVWLVQALPWLNNRFAGQPAPQDCSTIAPGNSIAPVVLGVTPITPSLAPGRRAAWRAGPPRRVSPRPSNLIRSVSDACRARENRALLARCVRVGRIWRGVCSHDVLTGAARFGLPVARVRSRPRRQPLSMALPKTIARNLATFVTGVVPGDVTRRPRRPPVARRMNA